MPGAVQDIPTVCWYTGHSINKLPKVHVLVVPPGIRRKACTEREDGRPSWLVSPAVTHGSKTHSSEMNVNGKIENVEEIKGKEEEEEDYDDDDDDNVY